METKISKEEKLADRIATGKQKIVRFERELLAEVGRIFEKKYIGTFDWFAIGGAACIRTQKEPCQVRKSWKGVKVK